jgi:hypothetical protein
LLGAAVPGAGLLAAPAGLVEDAGGAGDCVADGAGTGMGCGLSGWLVGGLMGETTADAAGLGNGTSTLEAAGPDSTAALAAGSTEPGGGSVPGCEAGAPDGAEAAPGSGRASLVGESATVGSPCMDAV